MTATLPTPAPAFAADDDAPAHAAALARLCTEIQPLSLALYRCVGDPAAPRLLLQASARRGEAVLPGDPPWTPLDALPAAAEHALHRRALLGGGAPVTDGAPAADAPTAWRQHVFALRCARGQAIGLLDLLTDGPLAAAHRRAVDAALAGIRRELGTIDVRAAGAPACDPLTGLPQQPRLAADLAALQGPGAARAAPPHAEAVANAGWNERVADGARHPWLGLIELPAGADPPLLHQAARLMRLHVRQGDRLYRLGAARFGVLLHAESRAHGGPAFERLQAQLLAGGAPARVACTALRADDTPALAIGRAEQALR